MNILLPGVVKKLRRTALICTPNLTLREWEQIVKWAERVAVEEVLLEGVKDGKIGIRYWRNGITYGPVRPLTDEEKSGSDTNPGT